MSKQSKLSSPSAAACLSLSALALAACGGSDDARLPQLSAATGTTLASCTDLATRISFANTTSVNGGAPLTNALNMGFAVVSSDAGHTAAQNFGIDPQARFDYGYQAAAKLTPMAKAAIQVAYGKAPDRSYFGG